eukprot:g26177.t1
MALYDLIKAIVLFLNAVAILNERFLLKYGLGMPDPHAEPTAKNRILALVNGDFKLILRSILLWINLVLILFE